MAGLSYSLGAKYNFPRSYYKGVLLVTASGLTYVQSGRDIVFTEHTYGGYRLRLTIKDKVWNWNSNRYTHDFVIENLYGMSPGDDTPIYGGDYTIGQAVGVGRLSYYFALINSGGGVNYEFQLPAAPSGYWLPPLWDG